MPRCVARSRDYLATGKSVLFQKSCQENAQDAWVSHARGVQVDHRWPKEVPISWRCESKALREHAPGLSCALDCHAGQVRHRNESNRGAQASAKTVLAAAPVVTVNRQPIEVNFHPPERTVCGARVQRLLGRPDSKVGNLLGRWLRLLTRERLQQRVRHKCLQKFWRDCQVEVRFVLKRKNDSYFNTRARPCPPGVEARTIQGGHVPPFFCARRHYVHPPGSDILRLNKRR
jgi:hypothetical protein